MSLWSPVDLLSDDNSVVRTRPLLSAATSQSTPPLLGPQSSGGAQNSAPVSVTDRRSGRSRDMPHHHFNGDPVNGSAGPPAAHSGASSSHPAASLSSKQNKRLIPDSNSVSSVPKRPRVRDYRGSHSTRHLFVDLPPRPAATQMSFPQPQPLALVRPVRDSLPCDTQSKDQTRHTSEPGPSESEFGAPLDLCIKKNTSRHETPQSHISSTASELLNRRPVVVDQNRRLSESSQSDGRSTPSGPVHAVFPKKRGRKPKSLLNAMPAAVMPSPSPHMAAAPSDRPRKRGRPPLMSPPPNIGVDVSASSAGCGSRDNSLNTQDLQMISNRLQARVFAQQQLAMQQGWQSLFPNAGQHPLLLPPSIRDALSQLSSLQNPFLSTPSPHSSRQQTPVRSSPHQEHDSDADSGEDSSRDDFRPDLNEEVIRAPLKSGWRRYTIINKISSSGVRGDVLYITPEGKKLRSIADIQRYLNKNNPTNLSRENFSFSCKWLVGEFNQPTLDMREHQMLKESEVINRIEELKRMKRKKMSMKLNVKRGRRQNDVNDQTPGTSSGVSSDQKKRMDEELLRAQAAQMLQLSANLRLDEKKIMDVLQSIQKNNKSHEKQKEEELARIQAKAKARELEMKRQQEEQLQKEQELQKRREMQMMAEIERERRRQHMLMVRSMDFHKRLEERERKREEMIQEKRAAQEKRLQKKRLEMELVKELRKPVDDMRLKDMKALPTLNRIPGLKLPAKAFSEILLVFEFLHNFGGSLGFDMDSLPSLNSFQLALLNMDDVSEDEMLSVLRHLLICVIEDPGLPVNLTTVVGQKLKDVPVTNFNLSEILRLYFQSIVLHRGSALQGLEGRIWRSLSRNKPFLSLPPTLKAEILAYLCNELLCNQSIVKQIDENIEAVASIRKDKWVIDCDLRKFKGIKAARISKAEAVAAAAAKSADESVAEKKVDNDEEDNLTEKKETPADEESGDSGAENEENPVSPDGADEEPEMSNEEIDKKIEKLTRQCTMMTNKLTKAVHGLRVTCLGQDRYRRRYWVLPAAGGVFVEGMESAEPEEMVNNQPDPDVQSQSQTSEPESAPESVSEEKASVTETNVSEESVTSDEKKIPEQNGTSCLKIESNENSNDNQTETEAASTQVKEETESENPSAEASTTESVASDEKPAKSETPVDIPIINEVKKEEYGSWFSILERNPCNPTLLICENSAENTAEKDAVAENIDQVDSDEKEGVQAESKKDVVADVLNQLSNGCLLDCNLLSLVESVGDICPSLQKKLTQQKEEQFDEPQKIPPDFQFGWWRLTDPCQVRGVMEALHDMGVRERFLLKHMNKYFAYITTKCKSSAAEFDVTELDRKIYEECSYGAPRDAGVYCQDVALRFDVSVVEEIETLEEKISNSSMQVRGWTPPAKIGAESDLIFKRSLSLVPVLTGENGFRNGETEQQLMLKQEDISDEEDSDASEENDSNVLDILSFGKDRLLSTEAMIERRYLKPPLGFKANTILMSSGSNDELAENAADENAPLGLVRWREAVRECTTTSQLALLLHFLESCIAWDKSIMRASCQFCCSGENEAQLLLCDGCDKGYHMYCFKPKMEIVPDGDWFCFECQNKNTIDKVCIVCGKKGKLLSCETCPKVFHPNCIDPPVTKLPKGKWSCQICIRKPKKLSKTNFKKSTPAAEEKIAVREVNNKEVPVTPAVVTRESKRGSSSQTSSSSKNKKDVKAAADSPDKEQKPAPEPRSSTKKDRKSKENTDVSGLTACGVILSEMETHTDAWPFKTPVNTKQFPTYKKIIKKPMDLQSMRQKLDSGLYKNKTDWNADVILMFDNCETFNEDESPVGRAGHNLRSFFDQRWKDMFDKCS